MQNKKGLSEIVSILVIVLLVIVAIGVIWGVVSNLMDSSTDKIASQTECLDLSFAVKNIQDNGNGNYSITIQRESKGTDSEIGVKINFYGENGEAESSAMDFSSMFNKLDVKTTIFTLTTVTDLTEIELTPYFLDETTNEEKLCQNSKKFTYKQ